MRKEHKTELPNDYIDKLKEWQEHQYDPGYYTGGNIPPVFTHTGRPKILGWFWIITSAVLGVIMAFVFKSIFKIEDILPISIIVILFYGLMILQFIGGLRLIKKGTSIESFTRIKKALLIVSCSILIIVALLISLNQTILKKKSFVVINDVKLIKLIQESNKNYVILNNGKLVLSCNFSDYYSIWEVKVTDHNASFRLQYEWNVLNPDNGIITKTEKIE